MRTLDATFPGTVVKRQGKNAKEFLEGLFFATQGLILSQVREITALDTPVIQNWINRGLVKKTIEKRYSVDHLARILLINMLRDVTRLETIVNILSYINDNNDGRGDAAIGEAELYICICDILDIIDYDTILSDRGFDDIIEKTLQQYKIPSDEACERLKNGIKMILIYYAAALVKIRADKKCGELGIR